VYSGHSCPLPLTLILSVEPVPAGARSVRKGGIPALSLWGFCSVPQVRARPLGANLGSARLASQPPGFITNAV
jgi:hypothetical protein